MFVGRTDGSWGEYLIRLGAQGMPAFCFSWGPFSQAFAPETMLRFSAEEDTW